MYYVLQRRLPTEGFEIYGQCTKFARVVEISQVLVFHFTTSFSGQRIHVGMDEMYEMY